MTVKMVKKNHIQASGAFSNLEKEIKKRLKSLEAVPESKHIDESLKHTGPYKVVKKKNSYGGIYSKYYHT